MTGSAQNHYLLPFDFGPRQISSLMEMFRFSGDTDYSQITLGNMVIVTIKQ